ncbi:MAG: hypothetical protein ACO1QS_01215 [Verrucomicrobiota bacterium]
MLAHYCRLGLLVLLLFLWHPFALIADISTNQSIAIEGVIISQSPNKGSSVLTNKFTLKSQGSFFYIKLEDSRDIVTFSNGLKETNAVEYREIFNDGTAIYSVTSLRPESFKGSTAPLSNARIRSGTIPEHEPGGLLDLWLIFCSGSYLDTASPGKLIRLWHVNPKSPRAKTVPSCLWERSKTPPYLLKEAYYLHDGVITHMPTEDGSPPPKFQKPFNTGYTNIAIRTHLTTNFGVFEFPLTISKSSYFPSYPKNGAPFLEVVNSTEIFVQKIEASPPKPVNLLLPEIVRPISITDHRLDKAVNYTVKSNWITPGSLAYLKLEEGIKEHLTRGKSSEAKIRSLAYFMLITSILLLPFFLLFFIKKNQPRIRKEKTE